MNKQIDHDQNEPKIDRSNGVWWGLVALILFGGCSYFLSNTPDWWGICLGFIVGGVLMAWGIEKTGNKVPDSWRNATRRSPRP